MINPEIENIIFDLGGVIINLSTQTTANEFAKLGNIPPEVVHDRMIQSREFHDFEKGLISDASFRDHVREMLGINASDVDIDKCWNAMLMDVPIARIRLLERLKSKYRIFLLSNTNEIHLKCFADIVSRVTGNVPLDSYFEKAYYSHRMKMRKPDAEIYDAVLMENKLDPSVTIFLDDNLANLKGAEQCGISTFHVQHPDLLFTLFP